jgi:hypothetical protein
LTAPTQLTFTQAKYTLKVNETDAVGLHLASVQIYGPVGSGCPCLIRVQSTTISGLTAEVKNERQSTIFKGGFSYPTTTADIVSMSKLDFEKADPRKLGDGSVVWTVTVEGQSSAKTDKKSIVIVNVTILDVNDNSPVFTPSKPVRSVPENMAVGSTVLIMSVTDKDSSLNGRFTVNFQDKALEQIFYIQYIMDGQIAIYNKKILDREERNSYRFVLEAKDEGSPPRTGKATVNITVLDVNDNRPEFTQSDINLEITENTPVGQTVYSLSATDLDEGTNGKIQFRIVEGMTDNLFEVTTDGKLRVSKEINYEALNTSTYTLIVEGRDQGHPPCFSNTSVSVTITDVNEHKPQFSHGDLVLRIPEDTQAHYRVGQVHATDKDSRDQGQLTYYIKTPGFIPFWINNKTGEIYTIQDTFDLEMGPQTYTLDVYVSDGGTPSSLENNIRVNVTIMDKNEFPPIFIQPKYHTTVDLGSPIGYVITQVKAIDADAGSFGIVQYTLTTPLSWIRIDANTGKVILSSRSVSLGVWNVTVKASDSGGMNDNATISIAVSLDETTDNTSTIAKTASPTQTVKTPIITSSHPITTTTYTQAAETTRKVTQAPTTIPTERQSSGSVSLLAGTGLFIVVMSGFLL